jgi:hypothetical protein
MCKVALEVGEGWYHVYGVKGIVKNVAGGRSHRDGDSAAKALAIRTDTTGQKPAFFQRTPFSVLSPVLVTGIQRAQVLEHNRLFSPSRRAPAGFL